jgi:hypothetical protein
VSERVRIKQFEASDARRILSEYWRKRQDCVCGPHDEDIADVVNRIGEIYETALARSR